MSDANKHPDPPSKLPDAGGSYEFVVGKGKAAGKLVKLDEGVDQAAVSESFGAGDSVDPANKADLGDAASQSTAQD
jgi:exopolyphosphatase/pppGpp-phosphohydrolase